MGDVWVDDHEVVDIYGVKLILNQKLSFAAYNVKELQVIMGMGYRMPITPILGTGNIQQFCCTTNGKCPFFVQTVMTSAHRNPPLIYLYFINIDIIYHFIAVFNRINMLIIRKMRGRINYFAQFYTKCTISLCTN